MAVAREWLARGPEREVLLIGTERGMEAKLVPQAGLPFATIRAAGLKGIGGLRLLRNLALLAPGIADSGRLLGQHRFSAALGVGGYASGPFLLAAAMAGVPAVIFEPNTELGFTNRVLSGLVRAVATAYPSTGRGLGDRAVLTGVPVRPAFFEIAPKTHQPPFRVLITGGSQGALVINRTMVDSLDRFLARKIPIFFVHQSGERDYNAVRVAYARREINAEVVPFFSNMAEEFAQADLIVCRAGAITAAEVAAAGRAAIFIPFGAATDSHQLRNAQALEAAGAARVLPEPQLTPDRLVEEVASMLAEPARIERMEGRARGLARPRAAADIVNLLEEVARP